MEVSPEPANDQEIARPYTAAMLAQLVGVPVSTIRRWTRRGHLVPTAQEKRLAYYDFQEASVARMLADLLASGSKLASIDRLVDQLGAAYPTIERPLVDLPLVIDQGSLFLHDGEALTEPGGQRRFVFDSPEETEDDEPDVIALPAVNEIDSVEEARQLALMLRDQGESSQSIEAWRLVLSIGPAEAEDHFSLAELLYERGDPTAARERYYMALELDESYLEARLNLACLLSELGQLRLAEAAFRGVLDFHEAYPDAHYHLAVTLDRLEQPNEAILHWTRFLEIAPDSPWAEDACRRLGQDLP